MFFIVRRKLILALAMLSGVAGLLFSCEKPTFTVADIQRSKMEVDSLYTAWWNAWLANDLDTWIQPLSNDVVMLGWPSEMLSGRELVQQAARQRMERTAKVTQDAQSERLIWQLHVRENLVWAEVRQRVTWTVGGAKVEKIINQTTVYEKQAGGWKVMQHHCSYGACESLH